VTDLHVNGCRLSVADGGTGPPVVLVHGLGGTADEIWRHQVPDLVARHRVVRLDLRGSGRSEVTPGPYTVELLADDVHALVQELGLGRVALVGHSMGGSIALSCAARHADAVSAVVGVGAPVSFPAATRDALAARAETVEAEGMAAVAETVATNGVAPGFRERLPDEFSRLLAMLGGSDPEGYAAQCRALVALDLTGGLASVTAPTLLVSGDRDGVSPPDATATAASLLPHAGYEIVDDCGHNLTFERPEALAEIAWPFLHEHA
jgi:3-oxoadipate enol-lactonase